MKEKLDILIKDLEDLCIELKDNKESCEQIRNALMHLNWAKDTKQSKLKPNMIKLEKLFKDGELSSFKRTSNILNSHFSSLIDIESDNVIYLKDKDNILYVIMDIENSVRLETPIKSNLIQYDITLLYTISNLLETYNIPYKIRFINEDD